MEELENEYNYNESRESLWETYIGKGGSSAFVFIYLLFIFICLYLFITTGWTQKQGFTSFTLISLSVHNWHYVKYGIPYSNLISK